MQDAKTTELVGEARKSFRNTTCPATGKPCERGCFSIVPMSCQGLGLAADHPVFNPR